MRITKTLASAALCVTVALAAAGCSDDSKSDSAAPKDSAAAKAELQAKADQRLAEIAAYPNLDPGIAGFLRETVTISLEYNVKATEDGKKRTLDDQIIEAKATRERLCISDGKGGWEPGSALTSLRDMSVDEIAKSLLEDRQVDSDAVAAIVAGRMLTAMEQHLCQGSQSGA